ncbi:MAG: valine--tRNA ligase [Bdellovibrionaceae bacterium]|nr:valine--tRNA ligase [Pseudobdellovibrionaceae bacterium]
MENLSDRYSPQDVETKIYQWWKNKNYFNADDKSTKAPYSIILPPPNVTGFLHMGHALDHTIQDVLIRWKRMSGFNTLWLPGTDHAGIATQAVVEKLLHKEEKKTRHDLGREAFVEKVWNWKHQYGERIYSQMERLGESVDWNRKVFTLDEGVSRAVRKVFVTLYKKGWIYRGEKLVNWSPPLQSAISDLEVVHKETKGNLWHITYPIAGSEEKIIIATTRPETMLGDTAVCVNPVDDRYKHLVGKQVILPLVGRKIPIIADEYVDLTFGTGALKVTPAHDFNDYELGKKHHLPFINILNRDGTINENGGEFKGLSTQEARKKVVAALEAKEFLVKVEPIVNSVGYCDRTGAVVEPYLSEQWFVRTEELARPARHMVENGSIRFEPEQWTKTYLHWMNIIQDWCISRQLWWGHRIPAWYCHRCQHVNVSETDPVSCEKCGDTHLTQESDVLDTWFSSALWPFSTLGWPQNTEALKTFYPTSVLVTGHDIIFFWVARMIMMGIEFTGNVPFRTVYIHGLIRDSEGRKMSKSLGNSIDPVEMIDQYGADALRFTLMAQIASGKDLKFSVDRLEGYRNFMNKIWNAARFILQNSAGLNITQDAVQNISTHDLSSADKWIVAATGKLEAEVDKYLTEYRFSDAANAIYSFTWHEFCDWYLEFSKPILYKGEGKAKTTTVIVLMETLSRVLRLLHPFAPFITEEIYQKLPNSKESCMMASFPTPAGDSQWLSLGSESAFAEMTLVKEVILAIRNIRGENQIKPSQKFAAWAVPTEDSAQKMLLKNVEEIMRLAGLDSLKVEERSSLSKCAVTPIRLADGHVDVVVPLEGLVNIEDEVKRIQKNMEKINKDVILLTKKLGNENFVKNAPEDIVQKDTELLQELKSKIVGLEASLQRLQS